MTRSSQLLLGQDGLDRRLVSFCQAVVPAVSMDNLPLSDEVQQALLTMVVQAVTDGQPLRLYFHGSRGTGKRQAAEALADALGMPLMAVDLARTQVTEPRFEQTLKLIFREAWFCGALLYLDGLDALRSDERAMTALVEALAGCFCLMSGQIADAVATAQGQAFSRPDGGSGPSMTFLLPLARSRATIWRPWHSRLRRSITWSNIVLPDDAIAQLREICGRVAGRERVLETWGFGRKLSQGKRANALLPGPSGTGKTMAAEIIG